MKEATQPANPTPAIRSYRIYLRDAGNLLARSYDVDLASDDDARGLAVLLLDRQAVYPCVEVWDRARLVCAVRKGDEQQAPRRGRFSRGHEGEH